ncbi:hypothetical protein TNCV_3133461 [Trichonephila clavipes]|nr:hypothetical protein TNCV_3133461 [Trichonephila clavipes]
MFDPSSFTNPTPLAHADASRDVLPRGRTSQIHCMKGGGGGIKLRLNLRSQVSKVLEALLHKQLVEFGNYCIIGLLEEMCWMSDEISSHNLLTASLAVLVQAVSPIISNSVSDHNAKYSTSSRFKKTVREAFTSVVYAE